jgi:RNA polymerase sigma-70 factor, ECF subfamily
MNLSTPVPRPVTVRPVSERDPDAAAVSAARRDPAQFVELYERYFARVRGYARLRLGDDATCEDVTSQVFLTALAKLGSYRGDGSFAAWLFRIAQNAVRDAHRRPQAEQLAPQSGHALVDGDPGPEESALASERRAELAGLLAELGPKQRQLIALRFGAGLDSNEIAQVLGKKPTAVRVGLHRALEELRRRSEDVESR